MANLVYNYGKFLLANGGINLVTGNLAVLLVANTYTADQDSDFVANIAASEITTGTVANYARQVLASKSITEDDGNDFAYLDATDITFSSLGTGNTIGGAILCLDTGSNTTSPLIAFYDVTDTPTNGGDITIQWASAANGGVLKLA